MSKAVLGLCLTLSLFIITAISKPSMEQRATERIRYYTQTLIDKKVPYVWGGYWIFGADCSGSIALTLKLAGIGGYPRTTSFRMWLTWPYKKKTEVNADIWGEGIFPNIIFFTYPNKKQPRPFGHVAYYWKKGTKKSEFIMAEASSSADYFKETAIQKGDARDKALVGMKVLNLTPGF